MKLKKIVMLILIVVISLSLETISKGIWIDGQYVDVFERLKEDAPIDKSPDIDTDAKIDFTKDEKGNLIDGTVTIKMDIERLFNKDRYINDPTIESGSNMVSFHYYDEHERMTAQFAICEDKDLMTEIGMVEVVSASRGYEDENTLYITLRMDVQTFNDFAINYIKVTYIVGNDTVIYTTGIDVSSYVDNTAAESNIDEEYTDDYFIPAALGGAKVYYIKAGIQNPFILPYESLPVFFTISPSHGGREGTYIVSFDQENKQITFNWHHKSKRVGFVKEHSNFETYHQYGVVDDNVVNMVNVGIVDETVPKYIIYDLDLANLSVNRTGHTIFKMDGRNEKLKNAFFYAGETTSFNQQSDAYVFVFNNFSYIDLSGSGYPSTRNIVYEFEGLEAVSENAGTLEQIITRVMAAIGDVFLWVIRLFLGSDVTIDSIIFNEYEPVVIDFEGGKGWFGQVLQKVDPIYIAFRDIAVGIYLVALLYIGLTILISTGDTFKQRRYVQHLSSWLVGLALLFVVPAFFKYLPRIANSIIGEMKGQVTKQYTYYNISDEKLKAWGFSDKEIEKLRGTSGEDTRTVWVEALIGKKEEVLESINELKEEYSDTRGAIKNKLNEILSKYPNIGLTDNFLDSLTSALIANAGNDSAITGIFRSARGTMVDNTTIERIVSEIDNSGIAEIIKNIDAKQEIIAGIDEVLPALQHDLMGEMRALAGETGRFAYVVVWGICIWEMIMILCMYYRRVIVLIILVMIYPFVAATYPFDKLGDGKSQSMSLWAKEFVVNIIVQVAHAIVYVLLVETGKELYIANSNNWLFFILAVMFLFPAERIIRSIFGMQASSIGTLRAGIASAAAGSAMLWSVGTNVARAAQRKYGNSDAAKKEREEKKKKEDKEKTNRDNRDKYLQGRADQKERIRSKKRAARQRKAALAKRNANLVNNIKRAGYEMMNLASKARSGAYRIGNAGRKLKGTYRKVQDSRALRYAGNTFRVARGAAGMAFGTAEFIKGAGRREGIGASFASSVAKGRVVGGFKSYGPLPSVASGVSVPSSSGSTSGTSTSSGGTAPRYSSGGSAPTGGSTGGSTGTTRTTTHTRVSYTGATPPSGGSTPPSSSGGASGGSGTTP